MLSIAGFIARNTGYSAANIRRLWSVRKAMKAHKLANPLCDSCSRTKKLHTHHIVPVHVDALLADDQKNMQTLCKDCHWTIGHGCNWSTWVPRCQAVAHAVAASITRA